MLSRRRILAAIGMTVATAGCSAQQTESSPRSVCSAGISDTDTGEVFTLTPQVTPVGQGDEPLVELTLPIRQSTVQAQSVARLVVSSGDEVLYRIPVSSNDDPVGETNRYEYADVVEYSQSLGHVPQNGIYRIEALTADGDVLDGVGIEFRCHFQRDEGSS